MDPLELYRQLDRETFQPSRIVLDDGRTFDVHSRLMVVVGDTFVEIGIQAVGYAQGVCERSVRVPVTAVQRVEHLANLSPRNGTTGAVSDATG